jgi:hypothetical protein
MTRHGGKMILTFVESPDDPSLYVDSDGFLYTLAEIDAIGLTAGVVIVRSQKGNEQRRRRGDNEASEQG